MKITGIELRLVDLPLVTPFQTSFGVELSRHALLVRAATDDAEGWGECVAIDDPVYSSEYAGGAIDVLKRFLIPAVLAPGRVTAAGVAPLVDKFKGHRMAKAALETAVLDAELRIAGLPLSGYLGGVRPAVPVGVSVGITDTIEKLLDNVQGYLDEGYGRIKLKIQPGWDLEPTRAVREHFGDDLMLQVDANTAYGPADLPHLVKLDPFDLLLIEQPFDEEDLRTHTRLREMSTTPVCLDESILSARSTVDALAIGACDIVNIKPGRVGGFLEARRIHDVCVAHGVPVWCGGMLETGLGRAANLALAALPGFTLPGDISSSARYFDRDLTEPFVAEGGMMAVPTGPGIGIDPDPQALSELTTWSEWVTA
ncbi:o-succinylbenzoate synthase [Gordonia rubripertincta]|uniref:o-succinylbenzoate synthase n=1 Tax=Gordonia rubripertincta TaxID=36822 RepID=A0ABT4MWF8_GORRU|nr:o-succinylbenzoate synthase [Gordonia rubripertincta]MCZ4550072.1 o-succinylbenzoate synthase [Gordonia rubripertincta]